MSYSPPTPPTELSNNLVQHLNDQPPERLRYLARYADDLAEYREREARLAEQEKEGEQIQEQPEDLPSEVPTKATITIKEINDNRYYYWQWRDGEKIRSKYKGPVHPKK